MQANKVWLGMMALLALACGESSDGGGNASATPDGSDGGGGCIAPACGPEELYSVDGEIEDLHVEDDGLYFVERETTFRTRVVKVSKTTGEATPLFAPTTDGTYTTIGPIDITGDWIYSCGHASETTDLVRIPITGGSHEVVTAIPGEDCKDIVIAGELLFVSVGKLLGSSSPFTIYALNLNGPAALVEVAVTTTARSPADPLLSDGTFVYYLNEGGLAQQRFVKAGVDVAPIELTGDHFVDKGFSSLVLSSRTIVYDADDNVVALNLDTGESATWYSRATGLFALTADAQTVYWSRWENDGELGTIWSGPHERGTASLVYEGAFRARYLQLDETHLYYVDEYSTGEKQGMNFLARFARNRYSVTTEFKRFPGRSLG